MADDEFTVSPPVLYRQRRLPLTASMAEMPPLSPKTSVEPFRAGVERASVLAPFPKSQDQISAPVVKSSA